MTTRFALRRSFLVMLVIALVASVCYYIAMPGRFAYAFERGRADPERLDELNSADVAVLERVSQAIGVIARVVKPSVVNVEARASLDFPQDDIRRLFTERGLPIPQNRGTGSGIILDEEGHIVTNNHVVSGAEVLDVTLADGRVFRAEIVGVDAKTDIAVIKIKADRLPPARFGDSDRVEVGNLVLAIGSPFRLGHSVSHGIISAVGRADVAVGIDYQNWFQTDAPINPGNSGGPLINTRGEVIGINTAIATDSGGHQGVGFAIPSNTVSRIAEQLKTGEEIKRGYLGVAIQPVTPKMADAYGLPEPGGVFIGGVGAGTPAAEAGLKPEDVILKIDGRKLETREQLQDTVAATKPGATVEMTVWRDGKSIMLSVTIGLQPEDFSTKGSIRELTRRYREGDGAGEDEEADDTEVDDPEASSDDDLSDDSPDESADRLPSGSSSEGSEAGSESEFELLGFSGADLTPALSKRFRIDSAIRSGVVITRITATGEAYTANLLPGFVITHINGKPVKNVDDLRGVLTREAVAKGVRLKVLTGKDASFYTVLQVR